MEKSDALALAATLCVMLGDEDATARKRLKVEQKRFDKQLLRKDVPEPEESFMFRILESKDGSVMYLPKLPI
mgnify:CR=1 FL=1